ncbi:hypothetical protein TEA_004252 [Camellia sinensis var. sinensis]|uniref:RNase H type-1 domain-containing protein n=1 Tax=Camellia sinensis var. sinensis TaxID=542762 RepID=A0A4S4E203_CAMSN|nr:hypothetical protein TEA_004252 [Camellia sinensis var. sinensis]
MQLQTLYLNLTKAIRVEVEGDNQGAIKLSVSEDAPPWDCAALVADIKALAHKRGLSFRWRPRSVNSAANWVARARLGGDNQGAIKLSVSEDAPPWDCAALVADIKALAHKRGLSFRWRPRSVNSAANWVARARLGGYLPNDLARLTLVGAVDFEQALTAAAADGGETAAEHIASGMPAMVVETVFPGPPDERSTVSTRLFLPARKVKEKAKKLKSYLTEDILSNTTSRNILAMTFRQVVMEQLWNFELQVTASFALSSSDELVISLLGEVVCLAALESTERHFLRNSLGRTSNNFFHWFHKPERIASTDSSVTIYKLFDDEIIASAKSLLETFNSEKGNYKPLQSNVNYSWWTLPIYSKLEKIGGPEFITWINEYVPAYLLQIDTDRLHNVKFEGWKKSAENRWEVLLTHFQMVLDSFLHFWTSMSVGFLGCQVGANVHAVVVIRFLI